MADAKQVLELAVDEAALLINSTPDDQRTAEWYETRIKPLVLLARDGLYPEKDGQVDDEIVRNGGLHPSKLSRLGL
jgi:hypothetical protein